VKGLPVAEFSPEEALRRFQLPSLFWGIKYFNIRMFSGFFRFEVTRHGLEELEAFTNRMTVAAGPDAIQAVKRRAIRDTAIGVGLVPLLVAAGIVHLFCFDVCIKKS